MQRVPSAVRDGGERNRGEERGGERRRDGEEGRREEERWRREEEGGKRGGEEAESKTRKKKKTKKKKPQGPGKDMAWFMLDSDKAGPELVGGEGNNSDLRGELLRLAAKDDANVFFLRHGK